MHILQDNTGKSLKTDSQQELLIINGLFKMHRIRNIEDGFENV